ncbi:MAG: DNA polymerase III subunit gamma/tau [Pirellulales bacterium]
MATDTVSGSDTQNEYTVVARRYRPQTFEQLIGQEHVGRALGGAINSNRVGHAYLFCGARGVGKTSSARILAKALNCEKGPTPTPCNECDVCQSINAGDDVDVLEIDGASNRGIDEMRELRQNVNFRPSRVRFKIYIIDEVHMLTKEAFNALLKTLEEPPEHVKFIFCTTEPEKIPITILSRCQRFDFAGIQTSSIADRLKQIAATEGVEIEQEAIEILARRAAGSMRDSQSLLEQLLSFGGEKISVGDVHAMLGTAGNDRLGKLVEFLTNRQPGQALVELDRALGEGVDVGQLLDQLLGYYRDVMVATVGASPDGYLYTWGEEQQKVQAAARQLGVETVLAVMQILDQTLNRLRFSTHRRTLAELAFIRIARLDDLESLATLAGQLREGGPVSLPPPRMAGPEANAVDSTNSVKKNAEPAGLTADTRESAAQNDDISTPMSAKNVSDIWQQVLARMSDMVVQHASLSDVVATPAPNRLVVSFRAQYNQSKSFCERPDQAAKLEKALAEVTGGPIRLEFMLLEPTEGETARAEEPKRASNSRQDLLETSQHPLVRKVCELFDAQPVKVEPAAKTIS